MTHEVSLAWDSGMAFEIGIGAHAVRVDTDVQSGGKDSGPSPKRLMLASLAGCTAMDIVMVLDKMRVPFEELKVKVIAELSESIPSVYTYVKIVYFISANVMPEKMERAVELSQTKYCGVSAMFRAFARLDTEIVYV